MPLPSFSIGIQDIPKSFIREIFRVLADPNIISFAGGIPNPKFFPVEAFRIAADKCLREDGQTVLQYSSSEGYAPLREWIAARYTKKGIHIDPDNVLITNGSQQGIDLVGKIFLNPGDAVLIENPSYLAAIQSFAYYQPTFLPIDLQSDGPDLEQLKTALQTNNIKFFYSIPNFQNPTGLSYSDEKRKAIAELLSEKNIAILEDDPYGDIRFIGKALPSFKHYADQTIQLGSFSKIVAPGCRLGWVVAPSAIYEKLYIAKQASDLHSNYFTQRILYQYLKDNDIDTHISKISEHYGKQKDAMLDAIQTYFPSTIQTTDPEGGMFLWLTLPEHMDAQQLFDLAIKEGVAFVPGAPFFVSHAKKNTLRLNFSNVDTDTIKEGMKRLGRAFEQYLINNES